MANGRDKGKEMQLTTHNGYPLLECASALQKCIRRGMETEAMFFAQEIESRFRQYLWVRLTAIVNEDIGLASPETVVLVNTLRQQYDYLHEHSKGYSERMVLANAILAMCRAPKTRLGDDFQTIIYRKVMFENWRPEVPDFALDRHTQRGRRLNRDWKHWREEGCKLIPDTEMNPYEEESHRLRQQYGSMPKKGQRQRQVSTPLDDPEEPIGDLFK